MSMTTEQSQPLATGGSPYPTGEAAGSAPADRLAQVQAELAGTPAQPAPGQATAEGASGGETPAEQPEPALVPSFRLREETEKRQELEQQLSQYEALQGWQPVIQALGEAGYSPEQIAQAIEQYQAQPTQPEQPADDPLADLQTFLASKGIDYWALDEFQLIQAQEMYDNAQFRAQVTAQQEQAQQRTAQAELQADLAAVTERFGFFQAPTWQQALIGSAAQMLDANPNLPQRQVLMQAAERLHRELEAHTQGQLATHAAQKAGDAQFPVTAGGSAPAPVEPVDITKMTSEQRRRHVESQLTGG